MLAPRISPRQGKCQSGIAWAGAGRTAFAVPVALGATRVPSECDGAAGIAECLGSGSDSPRAQALRDFFAIRGDTGAGCFVLSDERLYDASWIGEDAGPGSRTGAHALAEIDDVGLIAVCAPDSTSGLARREEAVVNLAAKRDDLIFLLERPGGGIASRGARAVETIFSNVALIDARRTSIGAVAGFLEATDWREALAYRSLPVKLPAGLEPEDANVLQAWRRQAGLRRSIDHGTRWMVFELSYPLLWKSVERDVSGFLRRLERSGFFCGLGFDAEDCRVECGPMVDTVTETTDPSRLRITLKVGKESPALPERSGWR